MTELQESCPQPCLALTDCNHCRCRPACRSSPRSALTDFSPRHLPAKLQGLHFLTTDERQESLLASNGRNKKIQKVKAFSAGGPLSLRRPLQDALPGRPPALRSAVRPPATTHDLIQKGVSGKTTSWLTRTKQTRRTSQNSLCKRVPNRKAPKFLSPTFSGPARQLFFSHNIFSPSDLARMLSHFNPSAFFAPVDPEYPNQPRSEISQKSRALLLNWILLVHRKFAFKFQTFFTAVNLLDSFLSVQSVPLAKLQLLGLTALFTAVKFEEVRPPKLAKFLAITEDQFAAKDVIQMEGTLLSTIGFRVSTESPAQLLELIAELNRLPRAISETALGFLVASAFDLRMNAFGVERIVAACVSLARHVSFTMNYDKKRPGKFPELLSLASMPAEGSDATCMRYLSLIVLNLERAGMLAIRKAFPASLDIDCGDSQVLSNVC